MQRVADFLKAAGTYYLATMDGDQPRVRPFGTVNVFDGKLYIQTGKVKAFPNSSRPIPRRRSARSKTGNGFASRAN